MLGLLSSCLSWDRLWQDALSNSPLVSADSIFYSGFSAAKTICLHVIQETLLSAVQAAKATSLTRIIEES